MTYGMDGWCNTSNTLKVLDCVSREAAIDACLKGKTDGLPATNVACDCCAERIRVLPSAQPKQRWIPCSARLPFDAGYYLTTTTYNEVFCDYWNLNEWNRTEQVIAWMPLPEPYKGGKHETD